MEHQESTGSMSGSFEGNFSGDGSGLTGVTGTNVDALGALGGAHFIKQKTYFLVSDDGTEKKVTFSNLEDSIFTNVTGDIAVAAGGVPTIQA